MTALTFPLSIDTFFRGLLVAQITLDDPTQVEMSQTAGGEQLTADVGPQLWTGKVDLGVMTRREMSNPDVLLSVLRRPAASFYAFDTRRPAPLADPTGVILGAAVPRIWTLVTGNREMRLKDLPASYVLSRGDYLAWDYAGGRRALHRVVDTIVVASGAGTTPEFEVTPPIRPGATVDAVVTLIRAACAAKLVVGSVQKGNSRATITDGMMFEFVQTLRVAP